jgi:hypothetical protein
MYRNLAFETRDLGLAIHSEVIVEESTCLKSQRSRRDLAEHCSPMLARLSIPILLTCTLAIAGCSDDVIVETRVAPPIVEPTAFDLEWPTLEQVDPSPAIIGQEVKIVGRGGYQEIETEAGIGYDESYRTFQLYLDDEAIGEIGCYVNRCEAELTLPSDVAPGQHVLSVEGGSSLIITVEEG